MANSIYSQLSRSLSQATRQWRRSILFRGSIIPCVVVIGSTSTALFIGGLQETSAASVKVSRELVPIGSDGAPRTNEIVVYPAVETDGIQPKTYIISKISEDEYSFGFDLTDPST